MNVGLHLTAYYLKILSHETMKLLRSTKITIIKDKNCENIPNLEIIKVALVHCNIVSNDYQRSSRVMYLFAPNKSFVHLLDISYKSLK